VDPIKFTLSACLCALLVAGASLTVGYAQAASSLAEVISSAVVDTARPEGDRNRDASRKPVESLLFSGIKPGDAVADFNAGAGYFTRLFSSIVGSRGHVYAIEPEVWDGKAELEEIEADGPKGHWEGLTFFLYNPSAQQWSQSFANSKAGILSTNIGEFKDGRVLLIGQDTVNDKTILVRAMWSDIKPDLHQYEEWYSNDGDTTWVRSLIANLTRLN
jgi:hypothetical protein